MRIKLRQKGFTPTLENGIVIKYGRRPMPFFSAGFTLMETLVAVGIFIAISYALSGFVKSIFFINADLQNSLSSQFDARQSLKKIVRELRSTSPSSLGAYPLTSLATSSITFYSNVDTDAVKERVRYFLQGTDLKRGELKPTGSPLTYNPANEKISTIVSNLSNGTSTPVFEYFDENYTGTTSPLTYPLNIPVVRLIRITLTMEKDPNRSPVPITVITQVTLRNLKDNL